MIDVRLTYLVDTEEEAEAIEGSAYATGGWVTVEVMPFWAAASLPVVVVAKWKDDDEERVRSSMVSFLRPHVLRPI